MIVWNVNDGVSVRHVFLVNLFNIYFSFKVGGEREVSSDQNPMVRTPFKMKVLGPVGPRLRAGFLLFGHP